MRSKILYFVAGVALSVAAVFGGWKANLIVVYDDAVANEAWCTGYSDGSALMYFRMMGIMPTAEERATVIEQCTAALSDGVELPENLAGPLVVE